jgi:hypothetical protein
MSFPTLSAWSFLPPPHFVHALLTLTHDVVFHVGTQSAAAAAAGVRHCGFEGKKNKQMRNYGSVWLSFFLTNFFENLAVGRIWLCRESEYY